MRIKVRIAVAANPDGEWHAYGFADGKSWDDVMDSFEMLDREQQFWVEAELDLPDAEPKTVIGTSMTAPKENPE